MALGMLWACAEARKVPEDRDKFFAWAESEGLRDPSRFIPALEKALEAIVPEDARLFDRKLLPPAAS